MQFATNEIEGPHAILDDLGRYNYNDATLKLRAFHSGPGKIVVEIKDRRRVMGVIVDAADLLAAVAKLVPAATNNK